MRRGIWILAGAAVVVPGLGYVLMAPMGYRARLGERKTVAMRVEQYGHVARERLAPSFAAAGVAYPPKRVVLVALKAERQMELWAADDKDALRYVTSYRIRGLSGVAGPKLKEGDRQVPEGIYGIESLNPNSRYHLSLRVNYPNAFDRTQAAAEGRRQFGGDIMIHGGSSSIGCLAMGDDVAEELFILAADTGIENLRVIICPSDFRTGQTVELDHARPWVQTLYADIRREIEPLHR